MISRLADRLPNRHVTSRSGTIVKIRSRQPPGNNGHPSEISDSVAARHILPLALLSLVLAVSFIVRIRLLNAPLERDEGEHAYLAQTILAGHPPWALAYNLKLPGTDFMYALFLALFGQTAVAIRLGLLLVNIATVLLIALLGKGFTESLVASSPAPPTDCFSWPERDGNRRHSTHYVVFFA